MASIFRLRFWLSLLGLGRITSGAILARGTLTGIAANVTRAQMIRNAIAAGTAAGIGATTGTIYDHITDLEERARRAAQDIARTCAANVAVCDACNAKNGTTVALNRSMSPRARVYQQFISLFPNGVEWRYNGVDFDGFHLLRCALVEAKDRYAFMLCRVVDPLDPLGIYVDWAPWAQGSGKAALIAEAARQLAAAIPRPPISLEWYFSESVTAQVMELEFSRAGLPTAIIYLKHPSAPETSAGQLSMCRNATLSGAPEIL